MRRFTIVLTCLLLAVCCKAERPPPPKAAPPLPPPEKIKRDLKVSCGIAVASGCAGAVVGSRRYNKPVLETAVKATILSFIIVAIILLQEEIVQFILKFSKNAPAPIPVAPPPPPPLVKQESTWWQYEPEAEKPQNPMVDEHKSSRWPDWKQVKQLQQQQVKSPEAIRLEPQRTPEAISTTPDIVVPDVEPPKAERRPVFWKRKTAPEPDVDEKHQPFSPPWADSNRRRKKNYEEEW